MLKETNCKVMPHLVKEPVSDMFSGIGTRTEIGGKNSVRSVMLFALVLVLLASLSGHSGMPQMDGFDDLETEAQFTDQSDNPPGIAQTANDECTSNAQCSQQAVVSGTLLCGADRSLKVRLGADDLIIGRPYSPAVPPPKFA